MKIFNLFFILQLILLSCESETNPANTRGNSINKIMPLGASRVEGNRPNHESYRYELWKKLKDNNWDFDFIGTQKDNASYNNFQNDIFDNDHEGHSGSISFEIANNLSQWLTSAAVPDIVLFSSPGGNDGLQNLPYNETITNIKTIISILQTNNPNVTVIIEILAPANSNIMTTELTNYLEQIKSDIPLIAAEKTTATSQVITVDMNTGFTDSLLADDVHYNVTGAKFIADKYYEKLETILVD